MRNIVAISLTVAVIVSLALPALGQDEEGAPAVTVVPDADFCNLVADDLAACEQALGTLASAGLLPEAFAGLLGGGAPTTDGNPAASGDAVVYSGKGSLRTSPFELTGGDYEVTVDTDCDPLFADLSRTDGDFVRDGRFKQSGFTYNLPEGRYYWDSEAFSDRDCEWTIAIQPL